MKSRLSMTSPVSGEACESLALASRIDQTQSQSQPGRGSERLDWQRRDYDTTERSRSDPGVLPQHQALQLLA
jgi:hypothetical protein